LLWLLGLLVALAYFKLRYSFAVIGTGIDGGLYTNIAQHVRDGNGLVTNLSLYHKGYPYFPHPTSVSPLWPWMLGQVARLVPIRVAAIWLPTILYFATLVLAYHWSKRVFPGPLFPKRVPGLNAGHVLVLVLGTHVHFFTFTSRPYTEGLAYALLFAALWRFETLWRRPGLRSGLEMGTWLGLAALVRGHLLVAGVIAVVVSGFLVLASDERRANGAMLVGLTTMLCVVLGLRWWHVASFIPDATPLALIRFDANRVDETLTRFIVLQPTSSLWEYVLDRGRGMLVAFSPSSELSYMAAYHSFAFAAPGALVLMGHRIVQALRQSGPRALLVPLGAQHRAALLFFALLAAALFLSLHSVHNVYMDAWHFGTRQGLVAVLAIAASLVLLLRSNAVPFMALGVLLLVVGTAQGFHSLHEALAGAERLRSVASDPLHPRLVGWINARRSERSALTIAMTANMPQVLSPDTPDVGYHWFWKTATVDDLLHFSEDLGADFVITRRNADDWAFRQDPRFDAEFQRVNRRPIDNHWIYERRTE
jgi:hypothetical protein